jgi:hypothetical protein
MPTADLKGLRVTHDLSEFDENAEGILVLEDKNVLDEDGDALTSVAVAEQAKAKKNIENRMKKTAYSALDENELENPGQTRILSQYDEEIDGPKRRVRFFFFFFQISMPVERRPGRLTRSLPCGLSSYFCFLGFRAWW